MMGDEVLSMASLVLILAIFMQRRRSFFQRMQLTSLQMRKMQQNAVFLSIQQQNTGQTKLIIISARTCGFMQDHREIDRVLTEELENLKRLDNYCKVKEMDRIVENVCHSKSSASQTEQQGGCLSLRTILLAVAFITTSYVPCREMV